MDRTQEELLKLGIEPSTVPPNQVKLLEASSFIHLSKKAFHWGSNPDNKLALAYCIDDEDKAFVGLVLRNLHGGAKRSSITVTTSKKALWHNLHPCLKEFYETGLAVLVEGPKDARVLWSNGIKATAYLGSQPSYDHLSVMKKYVNAILWIPDNDPPSREVQARKKKVLEEASSLGLLISELKIPEKDPAELVKSPVWFEKIKNRLEEIKGYI